MKRKVIKLGKNSLLVSLPNKWVKTHGITKGDELNIEEKEGKIILNNNSTPKGNTTSIDVTNLSPIIKRALGSLYKKGYDEFTVHFADNEEMELAHDVIREEFVGFEIVQHGKNHLVVREISKPHSNQFDTVLRRQFLVIKDFANDASDALAKKDHAWLKRLILRDKDVNKLADFCRRLINKQQITHMNTGTYTIVEQLEKISDRYRDICKFSSQKQLNASKSVLQAFNKVNEYLDEFYKCFYQFSLQSLERFHSQHKELISMLDKLHERASREEQRVLFWLEDIVEKTYDLNGPLMVSRL